MGNLAATHPGARAGFSSNSIAAIEAMYDAGLTDGLPVVPPTEDLVSAMLGGGQWGAEERLLIEATRDTEVTAY